MTRSMQQVQLDKQVMLLDSPGVVFAEAAADGAAAAALRNCVKASCRRPRLRCAGMRHAVLRCNLLCCGG